METTAAIVPIDTKRERTQTADRLSATTQTCHGTEKRQ
jgi:hypothetical protein